MQQGPTARKPDKDALYKVAYDEAVRALSEQQVAMDSIRSRAGYLLSAATITMSVLSAQALISSGSNLVAWVALVGFIGVTVASLAILWPRRSEFSADPNEVIRSYIEAGETPPIHQLHRDLSLRMHRTYVENLKGLTTLGSLFQIASGLVITEMVLWIVAIAASS